MRPLLALVHSPLVGPATWRSVAEVLSARGERVVVPDLTPALGAGSPYWPGQAAAVRESVAGECAILVGHSGAGPLLPAFSEGLDIAGHIFVDAGLPTPGESWMQTAPPALVEKLEATATDDWLPPWSKWWGGDGLDELLPDELLRQLFIADCPPLPLAMFSETRPYISDWPDAPCAYLRLSDGYSADADQARALGWPVVELPRHHLAMLTDPALVADALLELVGRLES